MMNHVQQPRVSQLVIILLYITEKLPLKSVSIVAVNNQSEMNGFVMNRINVFFKIDFLDSSAIVFVLMTASFVNGNAKRPIIKVSAKFTINRDVSIKL